MTHIPVLLQKVITCLDITPGQVILDGTFGAGGYTRAFLNHGAQVIAIDQDPDAIALGQKTFAQEFPQALTLVKGRFSQIDTLIQPREHVDAIVIDCGVSSMQLDQAERGFSFMSDGPLDMRMGQEGLCAATLVNDFPEKTLADIFYYFGEEKRSYAIARAICARRKEQPITRTGELAQIIQQAHPALRAQKIHPATRSFQALRTYINREYDELFQAVCKTQSLLKPGGRLVVVTFHSLEDRIVKRFLRGKKQHSVSRHFPSPMAELPDPPFIETPRGGITPDKEECRANPRARSARLRCGIRTSAPTVDFVKEDLGVPKLY